MPRIESGLVPVVIDLERGLRELTIPFGIVGALVPELLLDTRAQRMTNDADATVTVESLADFELLKDRLADYGFIRTRAPHRLRHRDGGLLDILPFSEALAPAGRMELEEGVVFNMAGFGQVVASAIDVSIEDGPTVPVAPLPLYVLLKLVAFSDRRAPKDLGSVLHCLEHYLEQNDRRYGVDHAGAGVPYEYTCAYLLGVDGQRFLDAQVRQAVTPILDRFDEPDADIVGIAIREKGRLFADDEERTKTFELFRWYRLGAGL
jgi:predicted nucleotidyltransferase